MDVLSIQVDRIYDDTTFYIACLCDCVTVRHTVKQFDCVSVYLCDHVNVLLCDSVTL